MHANSQPPPAYGDVSHPPSSPVLRRHKSTFFLLVFFLALLIIPWAVTCVLAVRPLSGASSYLMQQGDFDEQAVSAVARWYRAMQFLLMVGAVLTVPVISAVLSHAAVVLVQRRSAGQRLNARQLLILADAPWSRWPSPDPRRRLIFVYLGYALMAVGILQVLLQFGLIGADQVQVATYLDVPGLYGSPKADVPYSAYNHKTRYELVGQEPEPGIMALVPKNLVTLDVANKLSHETGPDSEYLWVNGTDVFASSLPSASDTGVLRYLATRLNSSITCENIPSTSFPATCAGSRPFFGDATLTSEQKNGRPPGSVHIRWCAPGAYDVSPWTLSRDRQDIVEEFFVDVWASEYIEVISYGEDSNFTTHCSAKTTKGYFELPNNYNQHHPGPLLERWPSREDLAANFNDIGTDSKNEVLWEVDNNTDYYKYGVNFAIGADPFYTKYQIAPGPLMTSMISMFGNETWFFAVQNSSLLADEAGASVMLTDICSRGLPWSRFSSKYAYSGLVSSITETCTAIARDPQTPAFELVSIAYHWFQFFNHTSVNESLATSIQFSNAAVLNLAANGGNSYGTREIYKSSGALLIKPSVPLYAKIMISVLLGLEVLGLVSLAIFIYWGKTFDNRIDAFSAAIIGSQLSAAGLQLPPLGQRIRPTLDIFENLDGVVGVSGGYVGAGIVHNRNRVGAGVREATAPATATAEEAPAYDDIPLRDLEGQAASPNSPAAHSQPTGSLTVGGSGIISGREASKKPSKRPKLRSLFRGELLP